MALIALITDFGLSDRYVGEMKGAIAAVAPAVPVIDICHDITPGDCRGAAFMLDSCYRTFPPATVFCVVVDPGVGSNRKGIVASGGKYLFVAPDNGVLTWALLHEAPAEVRTIDNRMLYREGVVSFTFHGRDIFGPVAAHCALGTPLAEVGAETTDFEIIPFPQPVVGTEAITAEIIAVDRFGNAVTTIGAEQLELLGGESVTIRLREASLTFTFGSYFASVPEGEALCYTGSAGYLEIGINGGSAAERFGLRMGDRIDVIR